MCSFLLSILPILLFFSSLLSTPCSVFSNLEICSDLFLRFFPVFFSALYLAHPSILFFLLLPVLSSPSLFTHFIFWSPLMFSFQICYPFSFLFSYYSIHVVSPLCSIAIQSVLFLLVRSIRYFFAISFALASVFFILLHFG